MSIVYQKLRDLSFRWKLWIAFSVSTGAIVTLALGLTNKALLNVSESRIEENFTDATERFQSLLDEIQDRLRQEVLQTVADPVIRSELSSVSNASEDDLFGGSNKGDILKKANSIFRSATLPLFQQHPLLQLYSADGELIFDRADPEKFGEKSNLSLLKKTATNSRAVEFWLAKTHAQPMDFVVLGIPIVTAGRTMGFVIVGEDFHKFSESIERATNTKIQLLPLDTSITIKKPQLVTIADEKWLETQTEIVERKSGEKIAIAKLSRSLTKEMEPFANRLKIILLLVALAAFITSSGMAVFLSQRIAKPLVVLSEAVQRIRKGDLEVHVTVNSHDEFGVLASSVNEMTTGLKQRDQIKSTFQKYLPPQVVDDLIDNPEKLRLGGEEKNITVVFADLAGFTTLSEKMTAEVLIKHLNEYFGEISIPLVEHGGVLKYLGDGVMAFFGAPIDNPDHSRSALLACQLAHSAAEKVFAQWVGAGLPQGAVRFGLHTGKAIVGNVGGKYGNEYTIIGDTVNTSSRMEGLNKFFGTSILLTGETLEAAGANLNVRYLGRTRVKGRDTPLKVYELSQSDPEFNAKFSDIVLQFESSKFTAAVDGFEELLKFRPTDKSLLHFYEKAKQFKESPPKDPDDLIETMTEK